MRVPGVLVGLLVLVAGVNAQVAVRGADDSRAGSFVSTGGQVRQQYERFANEEWGAEVPDADGYWLERYMFQLDARLSRRVRLYGELKSGIEIGRAGGHAVRWLDQGRTKGADLYYLGYRRKEATFDQGQGRELRHSWGARFWKASGALDYNVEAVVQTGHFANTDIRAWTIASDTGYPIGAAGRPRFGLRADITSGDRDRNDDRLGTFNPLFPKGAYFGLIASAGPSNHMDLDPQVTVNPRDGLVMTASWLFFWRRQVDDGIYGIPGNLVRSGQGTRSRLVGPSPGVEVEWQVTEHLSMTGNASLFTAGPFIQESGPARTIGFTAVWATYRF